MIFILEVISLFFGIFLFRIEVIKLRCKNFIPSMFLLIYVPLFCITPILYHFLTNGAISIDHKADGYVFTDPRIYAIYHFYNISLLTSFFIASEFFKRYHTPIKITLIKSTVRQRVIYFLLFLTGIYLYVYSTGLSVFELLIADRFSWFENSNYSSFYSVVASYFLALTPFIFFLYYFEKRYFFLIFLVIFLFIYGVLSKDRKWIIFILSGAIAAKFLFDENKLIFKPRILFGSFIFGLILIFWQIFRDVLFTELVTGRGDFVEHAKEMGENLLIKGDFPYYYFSSITAIKMNFIDDFAIPLGIIRRQVLFFVPADYSLGLKLKDLSAIFSDALDAGDNIRGGNMPPGLIGLFVLSFNWWMGILFYILIPFILFYVNVIVRSSSYQPVILSNCFSFMILLLRGDDSSAFYFGIFNLFIFFLIKKMNKLKILSIRNKSF